MEGSLPSTNKDEKGQSLFLERAQQARSLLEAALQEMSAEDAAPSRGPSSSPGGIVATGTGSSEAHARFLCRLARPALKGEAHFRPLSQFLEGEAFPGDEDKTLIIFSQGLSPNAWYGLRAARHFRRTILFSAANPDAPNEKGALLREYLARGHELIFMPQREEYTILIRVVGPLMGYIATLRWLRQEGLVSNLQVPPTLIPSLDEAAAAGKKLFHDFGEIIRSEPRTVWVGLPPWPEVGANLVYKFMEGLFLPCPPLWDVFQYSHGPFQEATAKGLPHLLIGSVADRDSPLGEACCDLLQRLDSPIMSLWTKHDFPWGVFELEIALNAFLSEAVPAWDINQKNWPGKGRDGPLYALAPELPLFPSS